MYENNDLKGFEIFRFFFFDKRETKYLEYLSLGILGRPISINDDFNIGTGIFTFNDGGT